MNFNIYNSLILAGIIQGLIFVAIVLLNKKYRNQSIYFLVALILCLTLSNLMHIIPDVGLMSLTEMYKYLYFPFAALFPPLYYFYVVKFLNPNHKTITKEKLLFLPFLIFVVLNIIWRIGVSTDYNNEAFNAFFNMALIFIEISSSVFTIIMLIYLLKKTFDYEKKYKVFDINTIYNRINWLKITLAALLIVSLMWLYMIIINSNGFISFYSLWIAMSVIIYWLGYTGIYKYGIIQERKNIMLQRKKHNNTSTTTKKDNQHIQALDDLLIHKKHFLDTTLTLDNVSDKLGISPSHLSRTVNSELGLSFTDYLNTLRVNEAKTYLINPEFSNYTIIAVGLEAGFNSKSTFFKVFKQETGVTPSVYKRQHFSK